MSKRDFIAIARIIQNASQLEIGKELTWDKVLRFVAFEIADHCKSVNPKFDEERFIKACEIYR